MFRSALKSRFESIFGLAKTTFDSPSDSYEQDTLFIEIMKADSRFTNGQAISRVSGEIVVFSQHNKMPYGYFLKKLYQADASLKAGLFFYDIDVNEKNQQLHGNLFERRASFVFLFNEQFDPSQGELSSIEFEMAALDQAIETGGGDLINIGDGTVLGV